MGSVKLNNAWFCPFGQRAWIAMLHNGVEFDYVERDPYQKTPEWLSINPRGTVPAIVHNGKSVYESAICIEYIDEAWPNGNKLLPTDPRQRALVRIWSDHIGKKIISPYYALLRNPTEKEKYQEEILEGVVTIMENMSGDGPFFMGADFGMVDIMLAPWAYHLGIVTKFYRDFEIPDNDKFSRYQTWWKAVREVPSVKATLQPREKLIEHSKKFSDKK